ncbi:glycosyltransferase [Synechococcales cyanobacterium C]|uniref:Glycosyltransferase n=1 Tax=Petrachloros mirabilis ULC683 TaxID=2781853 RepID=A0A8K2A114_9CYAN|nr:glycosyltransferase [Petrachloros mirabilis]NCJ07643.1 glycosyltransferase [Petrachloros mirabilis ULC683]
MNIVAFTPISGPYTAARYSRFSEHFTGCNLTLVELGKISTIYPWEPQSNNVPYKRYILSANPSEEQLLFVLYKNIFITLNRVQPDVVVICGYGLRGMLIALLWSLYKKKFTILLSETKENDSSRYFIKEIFKKLIVSKFDSALVGGEVHKRYLIELGMKPESIFLGYDVVGNDSFNPCQKKDYNSPYSDPYFLVVSRFVSKKNLPFLIDSYATYFKNFIGTPWHLCICGDGEIRPWLEKEISNFNLENFVHLPGFLQLDELIPYYLHAKCFIHASTCEQWGLVVNEAMASGLPVLVSDQCGCYEDLVLEGVNGFGFDPQNQTQLTMLMQKVSSGEVDLYQMGQASLQHIKKYSPDYFANGLMQAINYAVNISSV